MVPSSMGGGPCLGSLQPTVAREGPSARATIIQTQRSADTAGNTEKVQVGGGGAARRGGGCWGRERCWAPSCDCAGRAALRVLGAPTRSFRRAFVLEEAPARGAARRPGVPPRCLRAVCREA